MEKYLLGCDWGTSSFRLCLYSLEEAGLIDEIQSAEGVSIIHSDWQGGHYSSKGITKNKLFHEKLLTNINNLSDKTGIELQNTPILLSGMISSSIGMEGLPYAGLPFQLDGSKANCRKFATQKDFPHEMILISGVQSDDDVMRGEETQLIGIWSLLMDRGIQPKDAIFIFPGTHSKHVHIKDGEMVHFETFMTGEIYDVIANHSILKDSVTISDDHDPSPGDVQAFKAGVQRSLEPGILNSLFTVRTNQLFNRMNKIENGFYLSGLLIGNELKDFLINDDYPLFLCSAKKLYPLYKIALKELQLADNTTFVAADLVERAAMTGQKIIYEQTIV